MAALVAAAGSAGVETHVDTRATSLVVDGDEVVGVVARKFGESVSYRARNGFVPTPVGFATNETLLAAPPPPLPGHAKSSEGLAPAPGIGLALPVGGATRRMAPTPA